MNFVARISYFFLSFVKMYNLHSKLHVEKVKLKVLRTSYSANHIQKFISTKISFKDRKSNTDDDDDDDDDKRLPQLAWTCSFHLILMSSDRRRAPTGNQN